MGKDRKPLGTLAVVGLAAILLSAVALAVDADAAGAGKGSRGGGHTTATLRVSPSPAANYSYITISGSGFRANTSIQVGVTGYIPFYAATTDGSGSFSFAYPRPVGGPCTCSAEAWGQSGGKFAMLANASFTVLQ